MPRLENDEHYGSEHLLAEKLELPTPGTGHVELHVMDKGAILTVSLLNADASGAAVVAVDLDSETLGRLGDLAAYGHRLMDRS